ncbi:methyltransferase [Actinophytocola glycyrrhizae]|uniref:Methyltransferase n=1 Tax=Actinophytocola glycyrrhizae TaxID=2044873 RepID=A0ABV9S2K7_9PSEU
MGTNTDVIKTSYAAFASGDLDRALACFSPGIEWTHPDGMADFGLGGTKNGLGEVRRFMARARTVFSEIRAEPREFLESGQRVVVLGTHHMRGRESGVAGTVEFAHTWWFVDGMATHFADVHDSAEVRRLVAPGPAGPPVSDWRAHIIQLGLGFWPAKVVQAAVELGVFTELAVARGDAVELGARLGLHPRGTRDFLDTLVSLGLLDREAGRYRNTAATAAFLDRANQETYVGGILELASELWYPSWAGLTTALRTGAPQNNAGDGATDPFDVLYADPDRARRFQRAMSAGAAASATALPDRLPWAEFGTVVDVGCSDGALLARLLRQHPHLTGTGFDLRQVRPGFEETVKEFDLAERMSFAPGSFFTDALPRADVVVLGHVLHDWDLETKRMLLRKAREALAPDGLVVVYDTLIDDERRERTSALLMSLHMLLESPGGFDYTEADCLTWLAEAGFRDCRVEHLAGPDYLVTGRR